MKMISGRIHTSCPQCKRVEIFDPMCTYFVHLDELHQFSKQDQAFILFLKKQDKACKQILKTWKEHIRIKKGSLVRLHGLSRREDLNGKVGRVKKDKQEKNGVARWPVLLRGEQSDKTILVKRENFNPHVDSVLTILQIGGSTPDM